MTTTSRFELGAKKLQAGTAALAIAAAATITPVVVSHAAPLAPAAVRSAPVLTWGFDALDTALLARENNGPQAAAVGEAPTPAQLLQYLVQGVADGIAGIARGVVVIGGTVAYVAVAFTGGLITTIGSFLPGPIGDLVVGFGNTVSNVANVIAESLRVGPYATSTA